jgi:hypothetical protein
MRDARWTSRTIVDFVRRVQPHPPDRQDKSPKGFVRVRRGWMSIQVLAATPRRWSGPNPGWPVTNLNSHSANERYRPL